MTDNRDEPWAVESMEELLAIARAMEQEAINGYVALAERMRSENRPDLATVFDALVSEEEGHLGAVDRWIDESDGAIPVIVAPQEPLFDDEGAAVVAPELLNSYRAFSMAVRNEERAFVFWTYVAAHAPSEDIRLAAERMAKEELGHVAVLRRERRRAFHDLRKSAVSDKNETPSNLEIRLSDLLEAKARRVGGQGGEELKALAEEARSRSRELLERPWSSDPAPDVVPEGVVAKLVPLCQYLLDVYLDVSERTKKEEVKFRAQEFAGGLIRCLHVARARE